MTEISDKTKATASRNLAFYTGNIEGFEDGTTMALRAIIEGRSFRVIGRIKRVNLIESGEIIDKIEFWENSNSRFIVAITVGNRNMLRNVLDIGPISPLEELALIG